MALALLVVAQAFPPTLAVNAARAPARLAEAQSREGGRPAVAQQPSNAVSSFVKIQAQVIALTHVRVIDGTGAPAREDQTLVIRDGVIAALGDAGRVTPPAEATIVDLAGYDPEKLIASVRGQVGIW